VSSQGGPAGIGSGSAAALTSINVPAGTWDVQVTAQFSPDATTTIVYCLSGVSTSPSSFSLGFGSYTQAFGGGDLGGGGVAQVVPSPLVRVTGPVTLYAVVEAIFSRLGGGAGSCIATARIDIRGG
jgi:hypothetical protein